MNALLEGRPLDRRTASEIIATNPQRAAALLKHLRELRGVQQISTSRGLTLRLPHRRQTAPSTEVAVAACLGASLAPLFDKSKFERGMREAFDYVREAAPSPEALADFERKFYFVRKGGEIALPRNAALLERIVDAVVRCRCVGIRYRRFGGQVEHIRVEPLSLAVYNHQLYVVARAKGALHPYRFARIEDVGALGAEFSYPPPAQYDPDREFRDSFGVFLSERREPERLVLLLDQYWSTYAQSHRWHPSQHVEPAQNGVRVELRLRICEETEAWILGFGERAQILEPSWLRDAVAKRVRALALRYSKEPPRRAKRSKPPRT